MIEIMSNLAGVIVILASMLNCAIFEKVKVVGDGSNVLAAGKLFGRAAELVSEWRY